MESSAYLTRLQKAKPNASHPSNILGSRRAHGTLCRVVLHIPCTGATSGTLYRTLCYCKQKRRGSESMLLSMTLSSGRQAGFHSHGAGPHALICRLRDVTLCHVEPRQSDGKHGGAPIFGEADGQVEFMTIMLALTLCSSLRHSASSRLGRDGGETKRPEADPVHLASRGPVKM